MKRKKKKKIRQVNTQVRLGLFSENKNNVMRFVMLSQVRFAYYK